MKGVYAIARSIWAHPAFKDEPYSEREAWMWLIGEAVWQATQVRVGRKLYDLQRGQLVYSISFLRQKWKWKSDARVRRFLGRLFSMEMICTSGDSEATTITIRNYDEYQFSRRAADELATSPRRQEEEYNNHGGGGGGAPAPVPSPDCFSIAREIGQVCGYSEPADWPVGWSQAHHRVQTWLNEGWPKDAILAACKDAMARKADGPPSTINYFDKPIARWLAKQAAPLPEIKIQPRGTVHVRPAESDSRGQFREALAELRQFNRGGAAEHGGSGETVGLLRPAGRG